jgi:hypothetical protein
MARFTKYLLVLTTAIIFAGAIPQANAQVVVRIGHRHHHHHGYYRNGHRYYR